jgi:hypothetical protein
MVSSPPRDSQAGEAGARHGPGPQNVTTTFAEDPARLEPRQAFREVGEREHRVDHGRHAAGHLLQGLGDVAHRAAEGSEDPVLLLKSCIRFMVVDTPTSSRR